MLRTPLARWSLAIVLTLSQLQRTAPLISAIEPAEPASSASPQALTIRGTRFTPGLNVTVTDPANHTEVYAGPAIAKLTATSFELTATLRLGGDYSMVVTLSDRSVSNSFGFKVKQARLNGKQTIQGCSRHAHSPSRLTASACRTSVGACSRYGANHRVPVALITNVFDPADGHFSCIDNGHGYTHVASGDGRFRRTVVRCSF